MDQETEIARAKWLLIGVAVFLISGCISYGELGYLISGRDAVADITKVYESRGRRGSVSLTVEYAFAEPDGTQRKGMSSVSTDWPVPANHKAAVRYTPGADGDSRLADRVNWIALSLFGVSILWMVVFGIRLFREANDDAPRPRRPRRTT